MTELDNSLFSYGSLLKMLPLPSQARGQKKTVISLKMLRDMMGHGSLVTFKSIADRASRGS